MATCSRIAINGISPMAAPSSEQISGKFKYTVEFVASSVLLMEKEGRENGGKPGLMSPVSCHERYSYEIIKE